MVILEIRHKEFGSFMDHSSLLSWIQENLSLDDYEADFESMSYALILFTKDEDYNLFNLTQGFKYRLREVK